LERKSRAQVFLAVAGVLLATVLQAVDGSIVNVALPRIQQELGGSLSQVGWTVTGYAIASLIAMPLAASLAQRTGLRAYFSASIALFTAASAACGLSHSAGALIFFRIVQGFGAGGLLPLSQGILMTAFPGERRATAVALVGFAAVLGPLLGPPIGGVLTDQLGWQSIFWVNLPLGVASIVLLLKYLHVPRAAQQAGPLDLRGAAWLSACIVLLQLACAHHPWLLVPALAAGALFVHRERTTAHPAVDLSVLRHPELAGTLLAAPLYGIGLYGSVFLAPLLLERSLGMSASAAGLAMAMGGVASACFIVSAQPLLKRFRARSLSAAGAVMFAVSMLMHARLALHGAGDALLPQALRGAGTGLLYVGMNGFAFDAVPEPEIATSASLFYLLRQLGGALGIALCAGAVDSFGAQGSVASFTALALAAPLSLLPMALGESRRRNAAIRPA
jgi:MFS transporter, DHA2 family, multidrug resistance protein